MSYKVKIFFIFCIVLMFLPIIYLQIKVITMRNTYIPEKADAIIVLGHSLEYENIPSNWLQKRLETALYLYENNYSDTIIVAGGVGPTNDIAVAIPMKNWLIQNNVNRDHIILETNSNNTYQNFKFSKEIATEKNINSIIVVTNDFHMYRSMYIANMFFDEVSGKSAPIPFGIRKFFAYMKEPFSIIKYSIIHFIS